MHVRMVIGECISDDQVKHFVRYFEESAVPTLKEIPGFRRVELLTEDGGKMIIVKTTFDTREHCLAFHCSAAYRQFVARTQHLFLGNFVVKLFQTAGVRNPSI